MLKTLYSDYVLKRVKVVWDLAQKISQKMFISMFLNRVKL